MLDRYWRRRINGTNVTCLACSLIPGMTLRGLLGTPSRELCRKHLPPEFLCEVPYGKEGGNLQSADERIRCLQQCPPAGGRSGTNHPAARQLFRGAPPKMREVPAESSFHACPHSGGPKSRAQG